MLLAKFALRLLPVFLSAVAATVLGYVLAPGQVTPTAQIVSIITALIFYSTLITFRKVPGWSFCFLIVFGFAVGRTAAVLATPTSNASGMVVPVLMAMVLLVLAGISGRGFQIGFAVFGRLLWLGGLIYWAGLILLTMVPVELLLRDLWLGGGIVLFTGMAASWFANLRQEEIDTDYVKLSSELYLLGLNLWLGANLLL